MAEPTNATTATTAMNWFPVFMLLLGSAITVVIGAIENRRTLKRDREAREDSRRDQLLEHRNEFQRDTLVQLQEALFELGRTAGSMHHMDMMNYTKSGEWQNRLWPAELDEKDRQVHSRTAMLVVRVRDDRVRELVRDFKNKAIQVTMCDSRNESEARFRELEEINEELNQRIGELLRTMHDEETRLLEAPKN